MDILFENAVKNELDPGERVLWWGQPNAKKHLNAADVSTLLFVLLMAGWFIFLAIVVVRDAYAHPSLLLPAFVLLPNLLYWPFEHLLKRVRKNPIAYAVTSTHVRVLAFDKSGGLSASCRAALADIQKDRVKTRRDETGTLVFGEISYYYACMFNTFGADGVVNRILPAVARADESDKDKAPLPVGADERTASVVAFFDVDNAEQVYALYRAAKEEAK